MILYLEGNDHDQEAAQALLQEHGFNVSRQSGEIRSTAAFSDTAEEDLPLVFLEHSIDGIVILEVETVGVIYANSAFAETLGYSLEEVRRLKVWDWEADWTRAEIEQMYAMRNWPAERFETRHRRKDGRVLDVDVSHKVISWRGKEVVLCVVKDISERKKTERALHLTQFTVEKSIDQAFWITPEGRIFYVNEAACASLGYSCAELEGMGIWDIDPHATLENAGDYWRQLKEEGSTRSETLHRAKDGRIYPVEVRCNYFNFDGKEFSCAFATDISERKAAEEALLESEQRYREIYETTSECIFLVDVTAHGRFRYAGCNPAGEKITGFLSTETAGKFVEEIFPEELASEIEANFRRCLGAGTTINYEEQLDMPAGNRFFNTTLVPVRNSADDIYRIIGIARDITESRRANGALHQANRVVENSPAVLFRWKAQPGWPVDMVSRNVSCFGYTQEELLSGAIGFAELLHPEDLDWVAAEVSEYTLRGDDRFRQEYRIIARDGDVRWIDDRTVVERDASGRVTHYQGIVLDITERKRTELVMTARMRLLQFATAHTLDELLEATLNEAEALTESLVGFYHFLEEDQKTLSLQNWSTRTKSEFCTAQGKGAHYPVSQAGVWGDCIRERRPVIHDDYAALPHRKGLPPGHAPVIRELVVPVFRGEKIVAILGVGNKPQAYTQQDLETVSLLADLAWEIVERKQAEEALRESERRYRSIVEHAPFGISRSTREGKLLSVNPALASILKYDSVQELQETIDRSSIQDVLFPKPSEREPLVEQIFSNDSWYVFNNRLRCKDGSLVTCRVHSRPILDKDGETCAFESYQENITDQIEAEQALRESEEKFRVLAETAPVAISLYQGEHLIYANSALERLSGYSYEELRQTKFWDWVHEDDKELIRSRAIARLAGELVPVQYEVKCVTRDGEEQYLLVSAGTMEHQGRVTGVASFLDITERKRSEELIRASLAEKEVLLKEIHHRVKNNLQVVSSLLFLQAQKFSDPELQNCFLESQSRICSMALAHEQLYQSKNLAEISVKNYVESLVGQLEQVFLSPGQNVDCRLVVEDLELDIEKVVPCGLLITELLSNAYKHAFVDGRSGQVTVSLQNNAGKIELAVADDGVGLPVEFDCRQAKTLGLQLVSALVNQLGGTLNLESGHGTRFGVLFAE